MQESCSLGSLALLPREGARRIGPRRVRVYFRQVTGSPQRLGGVGPHVAPPLRLSPKWWPATTGNVKRRLSATGPIKEFAARPSGTESIFKIYAESFRGEDHLCRILEEAQAIVSDTLAAPQSKEKT